jgi:hypothetical protein
MTSGRKISRSRAPSVARTPLEVSIEGYRREEFLTRLRTQRAQAATEFDDGELWEAIEAIGAETFIIPFSAEGSSNSLSVNAPEEFFDFISDGKFLLTVDGEIGTSGGANLGTPLYLSPLGVASSVGSGSGGMNIISGTTLLSNTTNMAGQVCLALVNNSAMTSMVKSVSRLTIVGGRMTGLSYGAQTSIATTSMLFQSSVGATSNLSALINGTMLLWLSGAGTVNYANLLLRFQRI